MNPKLVGTVLAAVCALAYANPASADCAYEAVSSGTIPADGAVDVPLNAHFVAFTAPVAREVHLDGVRLVADEFGTYPMTLEPNTTYEVTFLGGAFTNDARAVTFTTGSAEAEPPSPPEVLDKTWEQSTSFDWSAFFAEPCKSLTFARACEYDTEPFDVVTLELSDAVGWWVSGGGDGIADSDQLWPRTCGSPLWTGVDHDGCYAVRAISAAGLLSDPVETCFASTMDESASGADVGVTADAGADAGHEDDTKDRGSEDGCSQARGQASFIALLLGWLFMRRRR